MKTPSAGGVQGSGLDSGKVFRAAVSLFLPDGRVRRMDRPLRRDAVRVSQGQPTILTDGADECNRREASQARAERRWKPRLRSGRRWREDETTPMLSIMNHRAKIVTLSAVALGTAVLVVGVIAFSDPIAEWWYLRQVKLGNPESKKPAARKLGAMGSVRAIPALLEVFGEDLADLDLDGNGTVLLNTVSGDFDGDGRLDVVVSSTFSLGSTVLLPPNMGFQPLLQIVAKRKQEALRTLLTGLEHHRPRVRYVAALTLAQVEPAAEETVRGLRHALKAETVALVRAGLEAALWKLEPKR